MTEDSVRDNTKTTDGNGARPSVLVRILLLPVRAYRTFLSPVLPPTCRFYPTCSAYAVEALTVHGVVRGSGLAGLRLLRCGPWHPGGLDPVPPAGMRRRDASPTESAHPGTARAVETPAEE